MMKHFSLLFRSTTAVCYYAMDYAEEKLKLEHLAVRFKLEETLQEFKKVFENCQADLRNRGDAAPAAPPVMISFKFNIKFCFKKRG